MNITAKGVTLTESMKTLVAERFTHLESHTPDMDKMHCHITYHESYQEFECEVSVHHGKKTLFAKERGAEFKSTLMHTFYAVEHQLEKQKTQQISKQKHSSMPLEQ
ncbi:HPF/RaiA family ribosome-associated protein [Vibrio superstes]|uniref:Ribosomal subunit interface protein n=1 Tax=Vibrio superstes NBRC 103154 TaxID=1219062 RepID=A0A511QRD5_9VIBR|nr:HPF/RaiA family ribosome-associated protein [Vibrio superstes]GEM79909.1 hypothetical protein VSU01S_21540 [Vibrio superstes NBRC 103154]